MDAESEPTNLATEAKAQYAAEISDGLPAGPVSREPVSGRFPYIAGNFCDFIAEMTKQPVRKLRIPGFLVRIPYSI